MSWDISKSSSLYGIGDWGREYFGINQAGNVEVKAPLNNGQSIDLLQLVEDLRERGLRMPLLIRFSDIINSRVQLLSDCFQNAIEEYQYQARYSPVFPIKVNQQRQVLEEIREFGKQRQLGLEAGSKPELLITLAMVDDNDSLIVCNGFKDTDYIETALLYKKLGRNIIIVMDRYDELDLILKAAEKLQVKPRIGFRAKLNSRGKGRWVESSGARSKFGLTPSEMVKCVNRLKETEQIDCLELLHFHIGSQIPSIQSIKASIKEAARYYTELQLMGAQLRYLDVGGGLGIDYDGSGKSDSSTNYNEQEYANDVISIVQQICNDKGIAHPIIVSESGRALVAHTSILVFDILGKNQLRHETISFSVGKEDTPLVRDLADIYETLGIDNLNESYNDLIEKRRDTLQLFTYGVLNLEQRAKAEDLYWAIASKMSRIAEGHEDHLDLHYELHKILSDTYYGNFSVFQSLPDSWALEQVFPVMPIHRLQEKPSKRAILVDLTCDSDGKLNRFIDTETGDVQDYLEVHEISEDEPYYMGVFLTGAYQEILGDMHNLFGDTDAVHVTIHGENSYTVDHVIKGDSVKEVLSYVDFNSEILIEQVRKETEKGIVQGQISKQQARWLVRHYQDSMEDYTYLSIHGPK